MSASTEEPRKESPLTTVSLEQRRLWIAMQRRPRTAGERLSMYSISGPLNAAVFDRAVTQVVAAHELLTSAYVETDGELVRVAREGRPCIVTWRAHSGAPLDPARVFEEVRQRDVSEDLHASGPLTRIDLFPIAAEQHLMLLRMHPLIADGPSMRIMVDDLLLAYRRLLLGEKAIPAGPLFTDYVATERRLFTTSKADTLLRYWRYKLEGLSSAYPSQPSTWSTESVWASLSDQDVGELERLARRNACDLRTALLTLMLIQLASDSGRDEVAIGTWADRRSLLERSSMIGPAENPIVLRLPVVPEERFEFQMTRVDKVLREAIGMSGYPFLRLVQALAPGASVDPPPFFQVSFAYREARSWYDPESDLRVHECTVSEEYFGAHVLHLEACAHPHGASLRLEYCTEHYSQQRASKLLEGLLALCRAAVN